MKNLIQEIHKIKKLINNINEGNFVIPDEDKSPNEEHKYEIGNIVTFMKSDYSTESGKIVNKRIGYINRQGYNIYDIELENDNIVSTSENDIMDKNSIKRKFYNPD